MSKNLEKYYNTSDNTDRETISAFRFRLYWLFSCLSFLQDSGGYAISRPNNLELHLGCHTCCGADRWSVARSGGARKTKSKGWPRGDPSAFSAHAWENCLAVGQQLPKLATVNSRLADTSLLRTPCYYGQQQNPRRKLQPFDWNKLPLLRTLATTDLRTLYSVPTSQFYCFLSRYSGHRAASWNICTHIKSIFSAFWDCLCLFWSISASSVHQSKFLHLFLLRPSLQSRCHE